MLAGGEAQNWKKTEGWAGRAAYEDGI